MNSSKRGKQADIGEMAMKYAHIFGSKAKGWTLYVCGASIVGAQQVAWYASKADAKACAKALGATPYNY